MPAYLAGVSTSSGQCLFLPKEEFLHLPWARKITRENMGDDGNVVSSSAQLAKVWCLQQLGNYRPSCSWVCSNIWGAGGGGWQWARERVWLHCHEMAFSLLSLSPCKSPSLSESTSYLLTPPLLANLFNHPPSSFQNGLQNKAAF